MQKVVHIEKFHMDQGDKTGNVFYHQAAIFHKVAKMMLFKIISTRTGKWSLLGLLCCWLPLLPALEALPLS